MSPEELKDYNNLVLILNEVITGWEKLDEYRKEKDPDEKLKKLMTVHKHETIAKRMVNAEINRLELQNNKTKAA